MRLQAKQKAQFHWVTQTSGAVIGVPYWLPPRQAREYRDFPDHAKMIKVGMTRMLIEQVAPDMMGAKAPLHDVIRSLIGEGGYPEQLAIAIIDIIPPGLSQAWCFQDAVHGFWRYEYGQPLFLSDASQLLWGTHMWLAVDELITALILCANHVPHQKTTEYLRRLDDVAKHRDVLCEMMPVANIAEGVTTDFEVAGRGTGNMTIDWCLAAAGKREVLIDVKTRIADLIHQMEQPEGGKEMPAPTHAPSLMYRGLEGKFLPADSRERLQGAWITTHIKQEASEIVAAFERLDAAKVHFAIFGQWQPGSLLLVRNECDRQYLTELFGLEEGSQFTFQR